MICRLRELQKGRTQTINCVGDNMSRIKSQVFSINDLCHTDAKKTCDSQRMGKREAVTKIRAAIGPLAPGGRQVAQQSWPQGREHLHLPQGCAPCRTWVHWVGLGFQLHTPASRGERKHVRSERNSLHSIRSEEWQATWERGPRMVLSLSGPISQGKLWPSYVSHVEDRLHHEAPGM